MCKKERDCNVTLLNNFGWFLKWVCCISDEVPQAWKGARIPKKWKGISFLIAYDGPFGRTEKEVLRERGKSSTSYQILFSSLLYYGKMRIIPGSNVFH